MQNYNYISKTSIRQLYVGPSIDQCVHKNCIIDQEAVHCYGENILIYLSKKWQSTIY